MKPEESTSPESYSYTFKVVPAEPEPTPPKDKNKAHIEYLYDLLTEAEADLKELSDAIYNLHKDYAAKANRTDIIKAAIDALEAL